MLLCLLSLSPRNTPFRSLLSTVIRSGPADADALSVSQATDAKKGWYTLMPMLRFFRSFCSTSRYISREGGVELCAISLFVDPRPDVGAVGLFSWIKPRVRSLEGRPAQKYVAIQHHTVGAHEHRGHTEPGNNYGQELPTQLRPAQLAPPHLSHFCQEPPANSDTT